LILDLNLNGLSLSIEIFLLFSPTDLAPFKSRYFIYFTFLPKLSLHYHNADVKSFEELSKSDFLIE